MPVRKFRSHDEARRALRLDPGDPDLIERIHRHWLRMDQLAGLPPFPPGVHKYRSIEEAQAARRSFEIRRARQIRQKTTPPPETP